MAGLTGLSGVSGLGAIMGASEIHRICPTITPTLGPELIVNGDFSAWTADDPDNWAVTGESLPTREVSEVGAGEGHGGVGTGACNFFSNAANIPYIRQHSLTVNEWHYCSADVSTLVAGSIQFRDEITLVSGVTFNTTGNKVWTGRMGNVTFTAIPKSASNDVTVDTVSVRQITFSSMLVYLGSRSQRPGTYTCHPTVADNTQTGILLAYADADNFVQLIVNRLDTDRAQLIKRITGTYSSVITGAIAYGDANELEVAIAANSVDYTMSYAGVQVGATTAINDAGLGDAVHGFNPFAGNSVGLVTTSDA